MSIIKYSVKLIIYFFSPVIIIFLICIYPFKKIRFYFLSAQRIGELAGQVRMHILTKKNNYLDVFFATDIVSNNFLLNYLKKKIFIVENYFVHPIWKILFILKSKINFFERFIIYTSTKDKNFILHKANKFILSKNDIKKGDIFLRDIGIPKNAKIVCLIIRDSKYLKLHDPKVDYSYHDYRNVDISNYKSAIKYLMSKNYYVFRMGVTYEKEINFNNEKFIDYSKKYRDDFLDIYLAYKCNFVITSVTGWDIVPSYFFHKPTLWTNLFPYHACLPYLDTSIFLPKNYYSLKKKKKISPWELTNIIKHPYQKKDYIKNGILVVENNQKEIRKATEEMHNKIKKNSFTNRNNLSKSMWNKFNTFINKNDIIYNHTFSPKGNFSNYYLRKNKILLEI